MLRALKNLLTDQRGQLIYEWGLMIALMVLIGLTFAALLWLRAKGVF
ncbi:MAG: hypothetical protein ACUVRC_08575 [Desulfotomaculales bacterium]